MKVLVKYDDIASPVVDFNSIEAEEFGAILGKITIHLKNSESVEIPVFGLSDIPAGFKSQVKFVSVGFFIDHNISLVDKIELGEI